MFADEFISPSIVAIFFSIIFIIWGFTILLLLQEKKGKPLFVHKIWRAMPVIIGVLLFLSVVTFIILGATVLSDLSVEVKWIMDIFIVYFLFLFYFLTLSIFVRYSNMNTGSSKEKILTSANTTVLIIIVVIFFLPAL